MIFPQPIKNPQIIMNLQYTKTMSVHSINSTETTLVNSRTYLTGKRKSFYFAQMLKQTRGSGRVAVTLKAEVTIRCSI